MKCTTCKKEFEKEKINKKMKATLSNPGDRFFKGRVLECCHCGEEHAVGQDVFDLAENFDKACREHEE